MTFTQIIEVDGAEEQALRDHIAAWDTSEAGQAPGYLGARLFRDDGRSARHVIAVEFSSAEHAQQNNAREATRTWAAGLQELVSGDPTYRNLRQVYITPT